jgi:hypothetical protein
LAPKENSKSSSPAQALTNPNIQIRWGNGSNVNALAVKISSDFSNDEQDDIEAAMNEWETGDNRYTFFQAPGIVSNKNSNSLSSFYDGEMGVYKSTNWFSNVSSNALAITQFYGIKRNAGTASEYLELVHADILVNYRDYNFSIDPNSTTTFHLPSVILHEFGHFLGLPHETDYGSDSVMLPFFGITEFFNGIGNQDVTNLQENYDAPAMLQINSAVGGNAFALSAEGNETRDALSNDGEIVSGYFELRKDGHCHHYINGTLVGSH